MDDITDDGHLVDIPTRLKSHQSCDAIKSAVICLVHINDFKTKSVVGSGFYSDVYKVTTEQGDVLALKLNLQSENRANCLREIELLRRLNHRNILSFKGVCISAGGIHPLTEFINGGTLAELIETQKLITWATKWLISVEVARGMEYLHQSGIFHRDLASKNIFLERDLVSGDVQRVIVGDFGLADKIPPYKGARSLSVVGSPFWMAPECMTVKSPVYDHKVDVFSYGIVLCELCAQVDADPDYLPRSNDFGIDWKLLTPVLRNYNCPQTMVELIFSSTQIDPDSRNEFSEIVSTLESNQDVISSTPLQYKHIKTGANDNLSFAFHANVELFNQLLTSTWQQQSNSCSETENQPLPSPQSNPFRSCSMSLPFRGEVNFKLWDRPNENDLFAAMDWELSEALKHAATVYKNKDDSCIVSDGIITARARSCSDFSSIHGTGNKSLPIKHKKMNQWPSYSSDSYSSDRAGNHLKPIIDKKHKSLDILDPHMHLETLHEDARKRQSSPSFKQNSSLATDNSRLAIKRKSSRSLGSRDSRNSGDSGMSSCANFSHSSMVKLDSSYTHPMLQNKNSQYSQSQSSEEQKVGSECEELDPKDILCEQVDELFGFLNPDFENEQSCSPELSKQCEASQTQWPPMSMANHTDFMVSIEESPHIIHSNLNVDNSSHSQLKSSSGAAEKECGGGGATNAITHQIDDPINRTYTKGTSPRTGSELNGVSSVLEKSSSCDEKTREESDDKVNRDTYNKEPIEFPLKKKRDHDSVTSNEGLTNIYASQKKKNSCPCLCLIL